MYMETKPLMLTKLKYVRTTHGYLTYLVWQSGNKNSRICLFDSFHVRLLCSNPGIPCSGDTEEKQVIKSSISLCSVLAEQTLVHHSGDLPGLLNSTCF